MYKYSLVLLAASAMLFNGCGEGECCQNINAPIAVIASGALNSGTLSGVGSRDTNADGNIVGYKWTVDGNNVDAGYTLPAGTHEVCLTVTDNDGLTNSTCKSVTIDPATNAKPVATVNAPATCVADANVNITGSGTDDGSIASYNWTPNTIMGQTGAITCPSSGSTQVCLTVTDNEGLASTPACKTITVEAPALQRPTAIISEGACDLGAGAPYIGGKAKYLACGTSHDNDNIDPTPDKGRTDTSIVKCVWNVSVYITGVENPHAETYITFLTDGGVDVANSSLGTLDPKWMGHEGDYKVITLTVYDDDDQNDTITKKLDYSIGTCGGLVDYP